MTKRPQPYLSYLLRLWRSGEAEEAVWRASLESPMTGKRRGFVNLKDLCAFLEAQANGAVSRAFEMDDVEGGEQV
jgi:hypothetical protein